MIQGKDFIEPAKAQGFDFWTGVPCSFLTPFINAVIDDDDMQYVSSSNEGDAVATASGAALAGRRAVAMMQNSGLGNAVSPLSSLNWVFRIPVLLIITLRGEPGITDEPQHELMGQITTQILDKLQIPWDWFPRTAGEIEGALTVATWQMNKSGLPYAFVMRKGSVAPTELTSSWRAQAHETDLDDQTSGQAEAQLSRQEALQSVIDATPEAESIVIGTTGYTGRELFAMADRPNQLYMVGSMGCASSFGLGLSLSRSDQRVVVVDGDGSALMRLGNMATAAVYGGENFHHLVLDNEAHESTGGQATVSAATSLAGVAASCGYRKAVQSDSASALKRFLQAHPGPSLLQLKTRRGVPEDLPRPNIGPAEVRKRLMAHLGVEAPWSTQ